MGPWDDWWEWIWPPPSLWTFVMERKTRTIALARGGKCNPTSSIGTFLLNSLSGFLCPWELRLALQSESKVLISQSFESDACSGIDFRLAQSFLHEWNKKQQQNTVEFLKLSTNIRKQKMLFHNISDVMCYETEFGEKQKHKFKHVVSRAGGEGDCQWEKHSEANLISLVNVLDVVSLRL